MKSVVHFLQRPIFRDSLSGFILALLTFASVLLLHPNTTPYDYYTRLATQIWHGNICLPESISWLNELVAIEGKGFCVVYPITPALVALPFVFIYPGVSQTMISRIVFALTSVLVFAWMRKRKHSTPSSFVLALIFCFATILFPMSAVGSAWYFAQTVGSMFLIAALVTFHARHPARLLASGFLFGLAANARLPLHLVIGYFIVLILAGNNDEKFVRPRFAFKRSWITGAKALLFNRDVAKYCQRILHHLRQSFWFVMLFCFGFLPVFFVQRGYNYARYTSFADLGYYKIDGKFKEADFAHGQFHPINIPKHAKVLFLAVPKTQANFPYIVPSHMGLSILLTSPFLVLGFLWLVRAGAFNSLATVLFIMLLEMSHGTVGFAQFGYRFALDVYPFLFLGFVAWLFPLTWPKKILCAMLITVGFLVNFWGTMAFAHDWFVW